MEPPDLITARSVFPDWPDELISAKIPGNWATMAQSFYLASDVLNQERRDASAAFRANVGQVLDPEPWKRLHTGPAMFFCLSFALELAIKAALVSQGCLADLESGDKLPFVGHNLVDLANRLDGADFSPAEVECLNRAAIEVLNGKYPVGPKPDENANGVPVVSDFDDFAAAATPLFQRIIRMTSEVGA